jgi:hypothetical protein
MCIIRVGIPRPPSFPFLDEAGVSSESLPRVEVSTFCRFGVDFAAVAGRLVTTVVELPVSQGSLRGILGFQKADASRSNEYVGKTSFYE